MAIEASVVVAVNTPHYHLLEGQLRQLQAQTTDRSFEVLIGDNDGKLKIPTAGTRIPVEVVAAAEHQGPAWARNRAAERARGRCLLFCDADDYVAVDWVEAHLRALRNSRATAGSVHVFSHDPADDDDMTADRIWREASFNNKPRGHEGAPFATSANMGIEAALFRRLGGFPVGYLRSEDVALSLAVQKAGVELTFVPDARVAKVDLLRSTQEVLEIGRQAGASRVRIQRSFGIGPRPLPMTARATGRLVRSLFRRNEAIAPHAGQVIGITTEACRDIHPGRALRALAHPSRPSELAIDRS